MLRGTEARRDSYTLSAAIESLGGDVNGLTQRDAMTLHLTVPATSAVEGVRILGEIVTTPLLAGLDIERNVVLEEILDTLDHRGRETDPDALSRLTLWAGHPLGLPVAGTRATVAALTEDDCRAQYETLVAASNGVLSVAGPVNGDQIFTEASEAFASLRRGRRLVSPTPLDLSEKPPIQLQSTDDAQVSLLFTYPAPHENDPEFPALLMLRRLLDDGFASRLRQAVCETRGLAYSVGASVDAYEDAGAFDVELSCTPDKVSEVAKVVVETLESVGSFGLSDEELLRIRARHAADVAFSRDDPAEMVAWYASSELLGASGTFESRAARATQVEPAQIASLAARVFSRDRCLLTLVGPARKGLRDLERLLGRPARSSRGLGGARRARRE